MFHQSTLVLLLLLSVSSIVAYFSPQETVEAKLVNKDPSAAVTDDSTGRPQAHDRIGIVGGTAIGTPDTTQTIPEPPDYARDVLPQETVVPDHETTWANKDISAVVDSTDRLQAIDQTVDGVRTTNSNKPMETLPRTILPTPVGCGVAKRKNVPKVGDRLAQHNSMPWMVSFSVKDSNQSNEKRTFCSGTLISDRHVLTSANCFRIEENRWMIKSANKLDDRVYLGLGGVIVDEQWNYNGSEVQFIQIHENFDGNTQENDIALVTLKDAVPFDDDVQPICLPLNSNSARLVSFENHIARIAGWGYTHNKVQSDFLVEADIPVIGLAQCKKAHEEGTYKVTDKNICAMRQGVDACMGDSGGPLMYETSENKWIIIGIISWGPQACDGKTPGVYTRITSYLDWIEEKQILHDETDQHERWSSTLFRIKKLENIIASQLNPASVLNHPPSSCQDLRSTGHLHSGFYQVQGSNGVDSVYCDMSKAANDVSFENRIGRVEIKSRSIFFYVSRMSEFSVRETVIPFEVEVMNIGGDMDTQKGVFTAPVGGIYFFSFSGVKSPFSKDLNVELRVNGQKRVQGYATSIDTQHTRSTVSLQSILQLMVGDKVDMFLYSGNLWSKYNTTQFVGFLAQENF